MTTSSTFSRTAAEVQKALSSTSRTEFSRVAAEVRGELVSRVAKADRNAEWQRVNSYIADVLKDAHVLYAKLARLQGDFAGAELDQLQKISEAILVLGDELSVFSKDFYEGKYFMQQSEFTYGEQGGAPVPNPKGGSPMPPPPADAKGPPPVLPPSPAVDEEAPDGGEEEDETYDAPKEELAEPAEDDEEK